MGRKLSRNITYKRKLSHKTIKVVRGGQQSQCNSIWGAEGEMLVLGEEAGSTVDGRRNILCNY